MVKKQGVYVVYGLSRFKLTANELQLMADALFAVNPDTDTQLRKARRLAASFLALSEYAESVK